jgi:hypothetical protein
VDLVVKVNQLMEPMLAVKFMITVMMKLSTLVRVFFRVHLILVLIFGISILQLSFQFVKVHQVHAHIVFVNVIVLSLNVIRNTLVHSINLWNVLNKTYMIKKHRFILFLCAQPSIKVADRSHDRETDNNHKNLFLSPYRYLIFVIH